ncbi:g1694 [Coccomyxa elongata]
MVATGKFRSKPWQHVLDEARQLVDSGVKELNLIAEDTNQYGMDRKNGNSLAELMAELGKLEGLHWMRILYAYPSYFSDALIDEIASNPKVCKYIDIPLQHISNLTLLGMNRPPQLHTVTLLQKLRERIPDLALRTTFIAGFPGETEEQHQELLQFCRDFKFERMGAFAYSEEDGTPAGSFPDQVPEDVRQARRDALISQQQDISQSFAESLVGREVDVLVEGYNEDDFLVGRTQWDAPDVDPIVFLTPSTNPNIPSLESGQMRRCLITGTSLFDLEAQPVS